MECPGVSPLFSFWRIFVKLLVSLINIFILWSPKVKICEAVPYFYQALWRSFWGSVYPAKVYRGSQIQRIQKELQLHSLTNIAWCLQMCICDPFVISWKLPAVSNSFFAYKVLKCYWSDGIPLCLVFILLPLEWRRWNGKSNTSDKHHIWKKSLWKRSGVLLDVFDHLAPHYSQSIELLTLSWAPLTNQGQ